ncbi:REP-associated tyrosine transposase [Terriglobus sp.]|uniref:REP-associated tyrosine transposase n=1 Tax=Terriglobus sp. TaxID=1889013 RepID=UPI003AFFDEBA
MTFSCFERLPYLRSVIARECFVTALERFRARDDFDVVGYVVMPEHVHLLVGEPSRCLLAESLHALKLSVAKTMRARSELWWRSAHLSRKERGEGGARTALGGVDLGSHHFWTRRYYDANLCGHDAMVECLQYTHRNPVKRGLVREPEDWRWSSYRHYSLREDGPVVLDSGWAFEEARWSSPGVSSED